MSPSFKALQIAFLLLLIWQASILDTTTVTHLIRVQDSFTAYVNDDQSLSAGGATINYNLDLPDTTKLLALDATATSTGLAPGTGFFILVNGTLLSSNNILQWRCIVSKKQDQTWMFNYQGWYQRRYDDTKWMAPYFVNYNFPMKAGYNGIWATGVDNAPSTIFCRGKTACYGVICSNPAQVCRSLNYKDTICNCPDLYVGENCQDGTFQVQVDDQFTMYMDGVQNITGNSADISYNSTIPSTVKVVGLDIVDGGLNFFIRVVSPFIDSDNIGKWACIVAKPADKTWVAKYQGWANPNFTEDTYWQQPFYRPTDVNGVKTFWAAEIKTGPSNIYCRGKTACFSAPCGLNQICQNIDMSNYKCTCNHGFTGTDCNIDINDCAPHPCPQMCIDQVSGYTCACNAGMTGPNCSTHILECASKPCFNGATCFELTNGYSCNCMPGYTGMSCSLSDLNAGGSFGNSSFIKQMNTGAAPAKSGGSTTPIIIGVAVCGLVGLIALVVTVNMVKRRRAEARRMEQERITRLHEESQRNAGWFSFIGAAETEIDAKREAAHDVPAHGGKGTDAHIAHDAHSHGHDEHGHDANAQKVYK